LAVRIYALAKELKMDSKVLVELCPKAGVTGKGSALASLTDEDVDKIKAFLSSPPKAAPKPAAPVIPVKPTAVPVLKTTPVPMLKTAPPPAPAAPPPAAVEPEIEPAPQPEAPTPPPAEAQPATSAFRREDYVGPAGLTRRPPVLSPSKPSSETKKRPGGDLPRPPQRTGPAIKLAPMPPAQQPSATSKSNEPAPQKPDIKLPLDAIRSGKAGLNPLKKHMQEHEEKRKAEAAAKKKGGPQRGPTAPAPPSDSTPGRDRGRKARPAAAADGEEGEASKAGPGGREQRQLNRKRTGVTAARKRKSGDDDESSPRYTPRQLRHMGTNTAAPRKTNIIVELPCTVRSFCEAIGLPAARVLGKLLQLGKVTNMNADLDQEMAELLAIELGLEVQFKKPLAFEEQVVQQAETAEDDPALLEPRAPVVTVLGHVDHGKTSLLDKIIGINVVSGESGGITQHIRAYKIDKDNRPITFVDTPGHEAFTEMRARGANVTDIAVLVVAADDGVMPQTEEAISHAKAAKVPIVVALNKIDLHGVDVQRIMQQLAANELLPTEWGGDTEVVKTSALTGQGIDDLLETLLTIAELHDYKANPRRNAIGTCLESEQHGGRGVVAKLLVQKGTLKVGDVIVCGAAHGRVKAMYDTLNGRITHDEVGPSTPVNVTGLDLAPAAGDHFYVLDDIGTARAVAERRAEELRQRSLGGKPVHVTLEGLFDRLSQDEVKTLNLILRADVRGSIEAIQKELTKLAHPEVQIKILQATVGGVTEADVHLADASDAIIIGFNVVPDEKARTLAEERGVQVRRYEIIYQVTADLKAALEGMLKPEKRDVDLGRALVQRTFTISRVGTIAGCRVLSGTIERNSRIRVIRENRIIGDYGLESLKRIKDDVREVREGYECGIKLSGFNDLKEGDVLEAYKVEEVARTI
jgi:translation initiation factor IF-2